MLWCTERSFRSEIDTVNAEIFFPLVLKFRFSEIKQFEGRDFLSTRWTIPSATPQGYCLTRTCFPLISATLLLPITAKGMLAYKMATTINFDKRMVSAHKSVCLIVQRATVSVVMLFLSHNELKNKTWYLVQKPQHSFQTHWSSIQIMARHCSFNLVWI